MIYKTKTKDARIQTHTHSLNRSTYSTHTHSLFLSHTHTHTHTQNCTNLISVCFAVCLGKHFLFSSPQPLHTGLSSFSPRNAHGKANTGEPCGVSVCVCVCVCACVCVCVCVQRLGGRAARAGIAMTEWPHSDALYLPAAEERNAQECKLYIYRGPVVIQYSSRIVPMLM